jgi:hypothetical protein
LEGVEIREGEITDLGTITVSKGARLKVEAFTGHHRAVVGGAEITLYDDDDEGFPCEFVKDEIRTDVYGAATIEGVPPGKYYVGVSHHDFSEKIVEVHVQNAVENEIAIRLEQKVCFEGIALCAGAMTPIVGAKVVLHEYDEDGAFPVLSDLSSITDESGAFSIDKLDPGQYKMRIIHGDYFPFEKDVRIPSETEEKTFCLVRGGTLLVRVKDGDGRPLEGYRVSVVSSTGLFEGSPQERVTDERGEFTAQSVAQGYAQVTVRSSSDQGVRKTKRVAVGKDETTVLEFVFGRGYTVYGTVAIGDDSAENMVVSIEPLYAARGAAIDRAFAITDQKGKFRIEDVGPGEYSLSVRGTSGRPHGGPGFGARTQKSMMIEVIDNDLEINIDLSVGYVSGIVCDENGGPIENADVGFDEALLGDVDSRFFDGGLSHVRADCSGKYLLKGIGKGLFRIQASKDGYSFSNRIIDKDEDQNLENIDFELGRAGTISGQVKTEDENPIKKVYFTAFDLTQETLSVERLPLDDQNKYSFSKLRPGDYLISINADGYGFQLREVSLALADVEDVDFILSKGYSLTIYAKDQHGNLLEDATASCTLESSHKPQLTFFALPSYDNGLIIRDLSPGSYKIKIKKAGYLEEIAQVQMTNEDRIASVVLQEE